jgi:hypothetical protein
VTVARKSGRPSNYSEAVVATICDRLATGESLRSVCRDETMPGRQAVVAWLSRDPSFFERYSRARLAGLDEIADQLIEIADAADGGDEGSAARASAQVQHAKLRIDTRKWLLSKLAPQRYGDRMQHEHTGDVVVTTRIQLSGASRRD